MSDQADQLKSSSYGRGLHGGVVTTLGRQIVGGFLQPGDILNMDRLEDELSVSRSVLREAVRVLSAKGLLEARPKRGTIVRPPPQWNLLDPDVMVWKVRNGGDQQYLRNWEEVRWVIEPQVVRLAALRRTERDLVIMSSALEDIFQVSRAARRRTTDYITADLGFHHAILMATRNDLLVQLGATMENALRQRDALVHRGSFNQDSTFLEHHRAVFTAIREQDEEGGERAMQALLVHGADVLERVLAAKSHESDKPALEDLDAAVGTT
jgi:GntR family galactonate operon transcriptional repressor